MLSLLAGCGSKTVITTDDFKTNAENHSYVIGDLTSQYEDVGYVKEATIAQSSSDGWQVEFYVLDNEANATSMFNTNKTTFESFKAASSSESSAEVGNYSEYSLTSSGYYMHLCRVENTLLYVNVPDTYKDEVKTFIKELGY